MAERRGPTSIHGRLLSYLLAPVALLLVAGVAVDHHVIVNPIHNAFDHSLSRAALAIVARIHPGPDGQPQVGLPEHPSPPLRAMAGEHFFYRVSLPDGTTLAGTPELPLAPDDQSADGFNFVNINFRGEAFRLASYRTSETGDPLVVTVAETPLRRDRAVHRLDVAFLINDTVQMTAVLLIALVGIRIAVRPLQRLSRQIIGRPPEALTPLSTEQVPTEVLPVVESLNTLLDRVRDSVLSQQHFLANAAHQLRTPLTGLKAQLEVLGRDTAGTPLQERIALLHGGVDRLAHTANQLLTLARAEPSAHRDSHFTPLDLQHLVGEVIDSSLDRALAHGIDLGADSRPVQVNGVYWLLHELLNNLIDNAIRHTPAGGNITIRCGAEDGHAFLEVDDSGSGIPPSERERVRERFYRGGGNANDGCGLGLAIVDEVARVHRAQLSIHDGSTGRGARMRIDFSDPA
ncbi:sensor histidine kinase [Dyella solisilvae]|uniref:histidine kinase n=1 Tax=Dyella solisilvae TaxID=1920168 RepID=A0A370K979_9GAMM|nr:sensor histidine kinase [Dyella solisilvae]RDI98590.1 sensor histidine kinase [Dyella solisilvae]